MPKIIDRSKFLNAAQKMYGNVEALDRPQVMAVCEKFDLDYPNWLTGDPARRVERGVYSILEIPVKSTKSTKSVKMPKPVKPEVSETAVSMAVSAVQFNAATSVDLVPEKATGYVPFGNFNDVRQIVKSSKFYPMYITGLSGNGKTMMIEQVCASEKREMVRVNITIETDEDDLIGGFRLMDGRTVWQNGPVVAAMERGAILLLDEVDLGSNKLMCLQPVLEGKSVYLKKINKVITPRPGFNIIATANTKGKGSDDGRFIGTNVMNEAFLERFSITMEQEYPAPKVEQKILNNVLGASGIVDAAFTDKLVQWADVIRKSFYEGAVSEIISTRRLIHICEAFAIFGQNRSKAIQLCLNRFDVDTKNGFLDLYKKLDETIDPIPEGTPVAKAPFEEIAF